ncbi:MAG: hypothetical protein JO299_14760, partial [Gammaproteobacteria bacterium]|nr:hypothetical protein [Gammaproteobacteria bacterium]
MGDSADEPAVAPAAGAGGTAGRGPAPQLRLACLALTVALALTLLLLAAYELAAARVPQHRAALEELIHRQTGLEVRFAALALRWGWYGPEALFQDVELSERQAVLLRAHRLIVSLDAWRMLRSGHLEARRITLEDPVIDLTGEARPTNIPAPRSALPAHDAGTRLLARWRGGEIDISGGTLRTGVPGGSDAVTFGIARAQLRRVDSHWSAEAEVVLPQSLGANLHLTLEWRSRADLSEISSATVSLEGHHLDLAACASVLGVAGRSASPRSGTAELQLQAAFVQGRLQRATGHLAAESLRWEATPGPNRGASLERLRGNWQLRQRAGRWHLDVDGLELETGVRRQGSLAADFSADGALVRAQARHIGLAPLLRLVHGYVPQPLSSLALTGEATELSFDWNSQREPGARLAVFAQLQDLSVMNAAGDTGLTGLSGRASAQESSLMLALGGHGVRLARAGAAPLEDLEIEAQVNGAASPAGTWQLQTQELHVHRAGLNLSASGAISLPATSSPLLDLRLAVKDTDAAVLSNILGPDANTAWGGTPAALAGGHIESAQVLWRGRASVPPWSGATHFTGSLVLRGATLREGPSWPELADLSAHIDWRGPHFHALIDRGRVQGFILSEARSDWDARAGHGLDFAGRLEGDAQQLIVWLRSHPEAAAWAPGLAHLDLRGHAVLDLELALPVTPRMQGDPAVPRVRMAALLDGVELHPVPGLPPLEALRGTLAFA